MTLKAAWHYLQVRFCKLFILGLTVAYVWETHDLNGMGV